MSAIPGLDFFLGEEIDMLRESVAGFAGKEIAPRAAEADRTDEFPTDLWRKFGDMGLLGLTVAEEYGGSGMGYLAHMIAMEEISRAAGGIGLSYGAHSNLCVNQIHRNGSEEQKAKFLPKLVSGEHIGALAMSEPNAGSDVVSMKLRADKQGDRYILNGTKMWITNGPQADFCVAYASADPELRHRAVSAFILEREWDGYSVGKVEEKMGIACSGTSELVFDNLHVPAANMLHSERKGFSVAMATLDGGRIGIAAQALGIAQRAFDLAVAYAQERQAFGRPIASKQAIQPASHPASQQANQAASQPACQPASLPACQPACQSASSPNPGCKLC